MTKALVCSKCFDIRGLDPDGEWVSCRCGKSSARWIDPVAGTVSVRASDPDAPRIMGLNNRFFVPAVRLGHHDGECYQNTPEMWRERHAEAIKAPGYIFDESKRACWACVLRVGETRDVTWEPGYGPEAKPA